MLISASQSALLVIDIQERLNPAMNAPELVEENVARLLKGAAILDIAVLASEQYPKGLGHTIQPIASLLPEGSVQEKETFSCMADNYYATRFNDLNKPQAIICGIEAHVCVLQTASELIDSGTSVFVVADATSSRAAANHMLALERAKTAGAEIVTTEMVLFEWLRRAGTPEFKEIIGLVK